MSLKIVSLNVKGLNSPYKRYLLWREALSQKCDILCAQETHLTQSNTPRVSHHKFPHCFFANSDKKTKGVLIAIRDTITFSQKFIECDPNGRCVILGAELNHQPFTLVSVYSPNTNQNSFLRQLLKRVHSIQVGQLIICGDFKPVSDTSLDSTSSRRKHSQKSSLTRDEGLYDVWRSIHGSEKDFTFFSTAFHVYSRIDMFLVDRATLFQATEAQIGTILWSDHAPISLTLTLHQHTQPTKLWRLKTNLLNNPGYEEQVTSELNVFFTQNANSVTNAHSLWAAHKAYMRGVFLKLGAQEKRKRTQKINDRTQTITDLETQNKIKSSIEISK